MKEARIPVPGVRLTIRLDDTRAARITSSWPYRRLVYPVRRRLRGYGGAGRNGALPAAAAVGPPLPGVPIIVPRPVRMLTETSAQRELAAIAAEHGEWYHTIHLGHGVYTPGNFDHEPALPYIPLPERLEGKRCLDVATLDGFWAFEMERRGAAEVVALDIAAWTDLDLPPHMVDELRLRAQLPPTGSGFERAARARGSAVNRRILNVYELSPERVGTFDLVFAGDLLIHLMNPHKALQNIRAVTRGVAVFVEPFRPDLDTVSSAALIELAGDLHVGRWWNFNRRFLRDALSIAGFGRVEECTVVDIRLRGAPAIPAPRVVFRAFPAAPPGGP